jgi:2-polyprenyl-3-methyl-5-hydroxy-6-metoxy-1,4-benzoquinol methylase
LAIGPLIRRLFGPYERRIAEIYRSLYIDLDAFVTAVHDISPNSGRILEVGCGEGFMTERLVSAYPGAVITAIDTSPAIGRLYRGATERVNFILCTAEQMAQATPHQYDLVILSDVLHHVPPRFRTTLLDSVRRTLAIGGLLAFKDWERNFSLIHWMSYASDRWLTGDRISYMSRAEMRESLSLSFGEKSLVREWRASPRWNNLATLVKPS